MSSLIRGDAFRLPLRDDSVDLIVTSPPYFAQRSYRDDGTHYDGQVGSEPSAAEFLDALWAVTAECWRVLKPSGSMFVNLGDKRSGSGAPGTTSGLAGVDPQGDRQQMSKGFSSRSTLRGNGHTGGGPKYHGDGPPRGAYGREGFGRAKSRMGLPERYVVGCMDGKADPDGIGWIYRQVITWRKLNGLPESVQDRTRDNFESWYHLTKDGDYYGALDEIREPLARDWDPTAPNGRTGHDGRGDGQMLGRDGGAHAGMASAAPNPLGRIPGSVWDIATEPLSVPGYMIVSRGGSMRGTFLADPWPWVRAFDVDRSPWPRPADGDEGPFLYAAPEHFAAFPSEWPRRLILGFSPREVCLTCGGGRRPVAARSTVFDKARDQDHASDIARRAVERTTGSGGTDHSTLNGQTAREIVGYVCACTPRRSQRGRRGDWRDGRAESADHGTVDGWSTPGDAVPRRPGGFGTRTPPPDGPMWEYELDGWVPPPSRPAIVLDPFAGTGTTVAVARALGRVGIGVDLSADYLRLARWRVYDSGLVARTEARTNTDRQGTLLL